MRNCERPFATTAHVVAQYEATLRAVRLQRWSCLLLIDSAVATKNRNDQRKRGYNTMIPALVAVGPGRAPQTQNGRAATLHDTARPSKFVTHSAEDRASRRRHFERDSAAPEELVAHPQPVFARERRANLRYGTRVDGALQSEFGPRCHYYCVGQTFSHSPSHLLTPAHSQLLTQSSSRSRSHREKSGVANAKGVHAQ